MCHECAQELPQLPCLLLSGTCHPLIVRAHVLHSFPCRCMCHECAQELRKQTSKCPICRNQVESLLHIKMYKVRVD